MSEFFNISFTFAVYLPYCGNVRYNTLVLPLLYNPAFIVT